MSGPVEHDFVGRDALQRGDTIEFTVSGITFDEGRTLETPGIVLRSTIKRDLDDPDPGLAQIDTQQDGIEVLSPSSLRVTFPAVLARLFPLGFAYYDVTADFSFDDSHTLQDGRMEFVGDVTRGTL